MTGFAYYNEIDPYAAAWLRNLIAAGHIAPGEVDERSIADVRPDDLLGFSQCHFFAGIGVWSYALRRAGWPDDLPLWTGSCPCQPFSAAGRGEGFADERHLWPAFHHLIAQRRPPVVFGEQVASKAVDAWIDLVQDDLEGLGYAFGAVPFPSAGVGAPHIRDRAYFVAHASSARRGNTEDAGTARGGAGQSDPEARAAQRIFEPERDHANGLLADACGSGLEGSNARSLGVERSTAQRDGEGQSGRLADTTLIGWGEERPHAGGGTPRDRTEGVPAGSMHGGGPGGVAVADGGELGEGGRLQCDELDGQQPRDGSPVREGGRGFRHNGGPELDRPGPTNGFWRDPDWLFCRDGRWRPVEPGTFPLAHGAPARVGRLRAYGNAINAEAAAAFISASLDVMEQRP